MTGDFNLINTPTKSKWAAHLLNLIFPGVGLIYWRRGTAGLYWLGLSLGVSVGFISIWMLYPFLPQLLASYLALYWGLAQWVLYEKVNARAATQSIWSRNVSLPPIFWFIDPLPLFNLSSDLYRDDSCVHFCSCARYVDVSTATRWRYLVG